MKTKSFQVYLEKRLNKKEISEIKAQAIFEKRVFESLQADIANAVSNYMKEKNIGFNEVVRKLDISPVQLSKIQKRQANLTIASLAHIFALLKKQPHLTY